MLRKTQHNPLEVPEQAARPAAAGESQLVRGLRALEALAVEPRTAAEVARHLEVNRSTSLRLLQELVAAGYVRREPTSKKFTVRSDRRHHFMANEHDQWDLMEVMSPLLEDLHEASGESVMLGAPAPGVMVFTAFFQSIHPVAVSERIGTLRPMHCSSLGKAYLSALAGADLEIELGRLDYAGGTDMAPKTPEALRQRIQETRARGYAIDREETFRGVSCVAAPARLGSSLIGAVGISGPSGRLTDAVVDTLGRLLVDELGALRQRVPTPGVRQR
jgi:DNA-binding IclR family transcriptional regulator